MKNLYIKYVLIIYTLLVGKISYSQNYITWNPVNFGGVVNGNAGPIAVQGTLTAGTTPFSFTSPAIAQGNLVVNGAFTFSTNGSTNQGLSRNLVLNFSQPVIITRYNMADIDIGNTWNDSFNFLGINFTNNPPPIAVNCVVNLNGVTANQNPGGNAEFASWFCSNPVTNFTINYQLTNGLTHAYLAYSIQVLVPPTIDPICLNSVPPNFPIVGNNIQGTWSPNIINTNSVGNTNYTFTPNAGQPIQCPINMSVNVFNCCQPTLITSTAISNMIQQERGNWIDSSDLITFSDGIFGNGVVYHAGNFVDLTPGFDAINGSQFVAYPEGCSGAYVYKNINPEINLPLKEIEREVNIQKPSVFKIYNENEFLNLSLINLYSNDLKIFSLDGKILYQNNFKNKDSYKIDISSFAKGVYVISAAIGDGNVYSEKFIKN